MKKPMLLGIAACGAIGALAFTSAATAAPLRSAEGDAPVLADIYVALDLPSSTDGPMVWDYPGIPVTDGVELTGQPETSNPSDWCGDITVDIAADLSSVTVTGGQNYCNFEEAYVEITLHGAQWGAVTVESDALFVLDDDQGEGEGEGGGEGEGEGEDQGEGGSETLEGQVNDQALAAFVTGARPGTLSATVHAALVALPTLQEYGVEGSVFGAYWLGTSDGFMSGASVFAFGEAPAAEPVPADPDFTG